MRVLRISLACALSCLPGSAQEKQASPELSLVIAYKIKPEMRAEFEAVQKEISAAYRKAEVPSRMVLQTVLGDLTEYVAVSPIAKFAQMDGAGPVARAIGQDESTKLLRRAAATYNSIQRMVAMMRADLSINTPDQQPGEYALAIGLQPAPGRAFDMEELIKTDVLAACKKAGVKHMWVNDIVFGGPGGAKVVVMPVDKMAAFDSPSPFVRALGPEGARKLAIRMGPTIGSEEFSVMRTRLDLSHVGQQQRAAAGNLR